MFKSIFSKKNRNDSLAARNEAENNAYEGSSSDSSAQQPLNEVLNQLYDTLDPSDPRGYAVAVAEVEYLWARYQQLIVRGQLVNDDILLQEPFKSKPFLRQVWNTIPRDSNGNLTFSALFGVLKWWESVDQETKLRGIFRLLNTGQPLDIAAIRHIIKAMDSSLNEDSINRKADLLMTYLDNRNQ
ncbi:uncharacterized protein LOC116294881, partial [Actinia tenebrosa]|uniref:Uncharacterized protein LOC116293951 n=1 Tax=Actinia tenebrosa TaxID=6105 RepID=A0A6P8I0M0_ACTTE